MLYSLVSGEALNIIFTNEGISPLKLEEKKISYAKRNAVEANSVVSSQVATSVCVNCTNFDKMIAALKNMHTELMQRKCQILTLAPPSWTIERTAAVFNASTYLVKKARTLKKSACILAEVDKKKKGKKLCQETVNFFVFYDNDEYSRMCPGQKEFKSIKDGRGKNTPNQKRLLLMNLTIYSVQKQRTRLQSVFVFFPQLCELRSPWCIIVGAKRTHMVCM